MEKVVNQDKLLNAGGTKKKATALLAASVCSGLQLSLNDVVFAADLWNLVLDSTARSDDLPMRPGIPPFFLAKLVWGSVFLNYLSQFSLIPSRLTNTISEAYERNFLLFPHVLQTLFLKRTNDTFLDHRTHHFLINTSRNKGGDNRLALTSNIHG